MAEKELKHLGRKELIEIIYELQKRETQSQNTIERLNRKLADREIREKESGSIAEAALALNGVFEAAQAAADQYLISVKAAEKELDAKRQEMLEEAREQANAVVQQGKIAYQTWVEKGEAEYNTKVEQAQAECKRIRDEIHSYMVLHDTLKDLFPDEASREVSNYA